MNDSSPIALARLTMSLPAKLSEELDAMIAERDLRSRSGFIVELIRNALAEHREERRPDTVMAGTITLVFRADQGAVRHRIAQRQRDYLREVISSQHTFLEDDQSMEVLLVQGPPARLHALCDELRRIRGVHQVRLVATSALLPPLHGHGEATALAHSEARMS